MGKHQQFTKEFKLEAVRLLQQSGRPPADVARELGIRRTQLYKWRDLLASEGEAAFPGHGRRPAPQEQIARLHREVERLREERDIFKKAAMYFAKESP